jgi:hypothetical protein
MKNIFFVLSVVAIGFTSCKKDRVCECTITSNAPAVSGYTYTDKTETTMTKVSKGSAKAGCVSKEVTPQGSGTNYTTTYDCKLK